MFVQFVYFVKAQVLCLVFWKHQMFFQVLPLVHNGLARFCSNVCRWMQQTANEGPYFEGNYTDGKISSKVSHVL